MLSITDLKVSFGGLQVLDLKEFELKNKELRVMIGPNGAGKSTFMDVLCGKTLPVDGNVIFNGNNIIGKSEIEIARMGIGRKFQNPSIFDGLSVFDNMMLGLNGNRGFIASLFYKITKEQKDKIHVVAKRVFLDNVLYKKAGSLSHGQKQWLEISIVLLQEPKLMLIDEPAAGMSDDEKIKTGELLCELAENNGVIVIEHDMHFVEQVAQNKVTVLVHGKILTEGSFDEIKNDKEVIDCYLGTPNSAQTRI